jgi:hypothetical protein
MDHGRGEDISRKVKVFKLAQIYFRGIQCNSTKKNLLVAHEGHYRQPQIAKIAIIASQRRFQAPTAVLEGVGVSKLFIPVFGANN